MITRAFDPVAAWKMRRDGWEPADWLKRMRFYAEMVDTTSETKYNSWRQEIDGTPAGAWYSRLDVQIEIASPHRTTMRFEMVELGGGVTYRPAPWLSADAFSNRSAQLMMDGVLPQTMLIACQGRRITDLIEHEALKGARIIGSDTTQDRTVLSLEPTMEEVEIPLTMHP